VATTAFVTFRSLALAHTCTLWYQYIHRCQYESATQYILNVCTIILSILHNWRFHGGQHSWQSQRLRTYAHKTTTYRRISKHVSSSVLCLSNISTALNFWKPSCNLQIPAILIFNNYAFLRASYESQNTWVLFPKTALTALIFVMETYFLFETGIKFLKIIYINFTLQTVKRKLNTQYYLKREELCSKYMESVITRIPSASAACLFTFATRASFGLITSSGTYYPLLLFAYLHLLRNFPVLCIGWYTKT
jgi:hypothetical protein